MNISLKYLEDQKKKGMIKGFTGCVEEIKVSKKPKYGNNKVEFDGYVFDSKKEFERYKKLKILLKAGKIAFLEVHPKFLLIEKTGRERKCDYIADFKYMDSQTGEIKVEDVKSSITKKIRGYVIKRKLMLSVHGITITEI